MEIKHREFKIVILKYLLLMALEVCYTFYSIVNFHKNQAQLSFMVLPERSLNGFADRNVQQDKVKLLIANVGLMMNERV